MLRPCANPPRQEATDLIFYQSHVPKLKLWNDLGSANVASGQVVGGTIRRDHAVMVFSDSIAFHGGQDRKYLEIK